MAVSKAASEKPKKMDDPLEQVLLGVWRQALVEDAKKVEIEGRAYPVRRTSRHRLRQVDFQFEGQNLRGLEQNPRTASRWAQLARQGKNVMQFLRDGRYLAVVADGTLTFYASARKTTLDAGSP